MYGRWLDHPCRHYYCRYAHIISKIDSAPDSTLWLNEGKTEMKVVCRQYASTKTISLMGWYTLWKPLYSLVNVLEPAGRVYHSEHSDMCTLHAQQPSRLGPTYPRPGGRNNIRPCNIICTMSERFPWSGPTKLCFRLAPKLARMPLNLFGNFGGRIVSQTLAFK